MKYNLAKLCSDEETSACAEIMSTSEPWITLKRNYEASLLVISDHLNEVHVAKIKGEVAGFVIVKTQGAFTPYVQTIAVKENYRGKGLGTNLIQEMEKIYLQDYPNIFMCVSSFNVKAKNLYERLGYEIAGELKNYIVEGHSEFILRKTTGTISGFRSSKNTIPVNVMISSDKSKLDLNTIHQFLTNSYWSPGISKEKVSSGIKNSLCFGLYEKEKQIGFARVITDFVRFAYLADVFVLESHRGKGYSKLLLKHILEREDLQVDKWMLGTKDAHSLYSKFGFHALKEPLRIMEKRKQ